MRSPLTPEQKELHRQAQERYRLKNRLRLNRYNKLAYYKKKIKEKEKPAV